MLEYWTIPTANITYTILQNYTTMVVGKDEIQPFEVKVVVLIFLMLLFDDFIPTNAYFFVIF